MTEEGLGMDIFFIVSSVFGCVGFLGVIIIGFKLFIDYLKFKDVVQDDTPPELGTYMHFKGRQYEVLIGSAFDTSIEDYVVVYKHVLSGKVYTRPITEWNETVIVTDDNGDSTEVLRFTKEKPRANKK